MTTVGYGDRVPISVLGRIFACFWILCGSTIMALLTAALTTGIVGVYDLPGLMYSFFNKKLEYPRGL